MGDTSEAGTAARDYTNGLVGRCPIPKLDESSWQRLGEICEQCITLHRRLHIGEEISPEFTGFFPGSYRRDDLDELAEDLWCGRKHLILEILSLHYEADRMVANAFGMTKDEKSFVNAVIGPHPMEYGSNGTQGGQERVPVCVITKKCFFADHNVESKTHAERLNPEDILNLPDFAVKQLAKARRQAAEDIVSGLLGIAFGRWPSDIFFRPLPPDPHVKFELRWHIALGLEQRVSDAPEVFVVDPGHHHDISHSLATATGDVIGGA